MARDVEFNITATDKTGTALSSAERNFKRASESIKKDSDKLGDGVAGKLGKGLISGVAKVSPQLASNLAGEFSKIASASGPILAGGIAVAAPLIGATLSAAIIGGAGIGGVLGGVALAARDPRVKAAGTTLGKNLLDTLTKDADVFVGPVLKSIEQIQKAFDANDSHIQSIFKNSARFVEPLTTGVTGLLAGVLRGIDALVAHAGPVIAALSKGFTQVGNSLGDAFEDIAGQSEGAAAALGDVFGAISGIIQVIGPVLAGLTAVYGVLAKIGLTKGLFTALLGPIGMVGSLFVKTGDSARKTGSGTFGLAAGLDATTGAAGGLAKQLDSTTASQDDLRASAQQLTGQQNDLYSSTTDVGNAYAATSKKIKENGSSLSLNTAKGRANREALSALAGSLQKNYDAYVRVNGVGPKSAALADNLRNKFIALAQKAGASAGAARNLANQLLSIPSSRTTKITANAAQALEAAREVRRAISSVQSKTVTLTIARKVTGSSGSNSALDSALRKQNYSTAGSFQATSGGQSRVGGPREVTVKSDVNVFLDGTPFAGLVATAVATNNKKQALRQKVGQRR